MDAARHTRSPCPTVCALIACMLLTLGRSPAAADEVRILDCAYDALDARIELIRSAGCTVNAAYLEFADDPTAHCLLEELRQAACCGLQVRLLVDACYNMIPASTLRQLAADGIEVREFHPPRWSKLHQSAYRMHGKLLIVDSKAAIVGGRNICGSYFGNAPNEYFRDRDVLLTGCAAADADAFFLQMWHSKHVRPAASSTSASGLCDCRRLLAPPNLLKWCRVLAKGGVTSRLAEACGIRPADCGIGDPASFARQRRCGMQPVIPVDPQSIRFVHSQRIIGGPHCDITDELLNLIRTSQRSIVIETPYLVLSRKFRCELGCAVSRGVTVHLITNSAATTNQMIAQAGYANQKRMLLAMGIHVWEYQGPGCLHAKCWVVDDHAVIGSYNLDPRSEHYDIQTCVIIHDAAAAAALLSLVASDACRYSLPVACDGKVSGRPGKRENRNRLRPALMHALRPAALLLERQL